jgi:hypothetical protein
MNQSLTVLYAFRNRDVQRVRLSLDSLQQQNNSDFKVIFIDYGSEQELAMAIQTVVESYSFAAYYYISARTLLWCKSKALNYGIKKVKTAYVFVADVDLIFSPNTIAYFKKIIHPDKINLFKLGYLDKQNSLQLTKPYQFKELKPKHYGTINGMILVSKKALEKVQGYDTFFHFYGAEDVDLYNRLANAGYDIINNKETYFFHNWHVIYNAYNDKKMSANPHLYNIKRINQQHYFNNINNKLVIPYRQPCFGSVVTEEEQRFIENPMLTIELKNIHAQIDHFFNEQIRTYKNIVLCVIVKEEVCHKSVKHFLKKILKKQSEPYLSMKEVNDTILKKILYEYRDTNYAYKIADDLRTITFTIRL